MVKLNENYLKLPGSYLFAEIDLPGDSLYGGVS